MDNEEALRMDSVILLSWVNMKLRDEGIDFRELCAEYDMSMEDIDRKLRSAGYEYCEGINQFR